MSYNAVTEVHAILGFKDNFCLVYSISVSGHELQYHL
mgnify:CR=1 FL=1